MLNDIARPDADGRFGKFGGKYVPETLIPALLALTAEYEDAMKDEAFQVRTLPVLHCCQTLHTASHVALHGIRMHEHILCI